MKMKLWTAVVIFITLMVSAQSARSQTLLSENFDDQSYSSPLSIYNRTGYDVNLNYTNNHARGGTGYCLQFDDALSGYQVFVLNGMANYLENGLYFRYYVYWDSNYHFGSDDGQLDNKKMFKTAGQSEGVPDIEIIYRPYNTGIDVYCPQDTGHVERYFSGSGQIKGQWNKIEMYIRVDSGNNVLHVQVNDVDLCNYVPGFSTPASQYTGTQQFISTRSTSLPSSGHGYWWVDDVTVVYNEGDMCNNEPTEPGSSGDQEPSQPIDNPPSINITSPTSQTTFNSSLPTVNLGGISSDDNGISSISWVSNRGGQGNATNNSGDWASWVAGNVPLQEGENVITVTATDTATQSSTDTITVTYMPTSEAIQAWSAVAQTGNSTWEDSTATWCARVLIEGASIVQSGNGVMLGFQGRSSGDYRIRKVSIAEADPNGVEGDVIDSTWTSVTFDGNSAATWGTDVATVSAGREKLSDPVSFPIQAGKNYYITYLLSSPSVYLIAPSYYHEFYFDGSDHAEDVDWSTNGHSTYDARLHSISKIYVVSGGDDAPQSPPGTPGSAHIEQ